MAQESLPEDIEWSSFTYDRWTWRWFIESKDFKCIYKYREENTIAHLLTNLARTQNLSYVDFTFPLFLNI
jgi:hypothetical protein